MSTSDNKPMFRNSFMGYNKTEVDDYIARIESELEISENRQEKWEHKIQELNATIERLNHESDEQQKSCEELQKKNSETISRLENQLQNEKEEKLRFEKRIKELQEKIDSAGADPKTIQDAILNAQRMSEMLISEANEKADEIRNQAHIYQMEQESIAKRIVTDAEKEAEKVTEEAAVKCESLQRDYNSALLDVTQFKAELIQMYQKHIKLLDSLPEIKTPELDCIVADTVIKEIANEENDA